MKGFELNRGEDRSESKENCGEGASLEEGKRQKYKMISG